MPLSTQSNFKAPFALASRLSAAGCHPPALVASLRSLESSLATGNLDGAAWATHNSLEQLTYFFTAATAGVLLTNDPSRIDIATLAAGQLNLTNCERLLQLSYEPIRSNPGTRFTTLTDVLSSNQRLHDWLGLAPTVLPPNFPLPISSIALNLQPHLRAQQLGSTLQQLESYLEILEIWLTQAETLFGSYRRIIDQGRWIGLEPSHGAEGRLMFVPAFEWTGEPAPPESEPELDWQIEGQTAESQSDEPVEQLTSLNTEAWALDPITDDQSEEQLQVEPLVQQTLLDTEVEDPDPIPDSQSEQQLQAEPLAQQTLLDIEVEDPDPIPDSQSEQQLQAEPLAQQTLLDIEVEDPDPIPDSQYEEQLQAEPLAQQTLLDIEVEDPDLSPDSQYEEQLQAEPLAQQTPFRHRSRSCTPQF